MSTQISSTSKEWELRDYVGALRRRAALVIGAAIITAVLAGAFSVLQAKQYEATAQVLIERQASDQVFENGSPVFDPKRDIQTEVSVLNSAAVQRAARDRIGHAPDVTISSDETSNVIGVTASAPSPARAVSDANQYAQTYVDYRRKHAVSDLAEASRQVQSRIDQLDQRLAQLPPSSSERSALDDQRSYLAQQLSRLQVSANLSNAGGASLIAKAEPPSAPVSTNMLRNALLGSVLGLLVGSALAFLLEYFEDGVRDRARLEGAFDGRVPVLAEIPLVQSWKKTTNGAVTSALEPWSPASEAFRALRTSVSFVSDRRNIASIQVTSANDEEGKTTVASHLAVAIARAGRKVVLVGGDLRRPRLHEFFGATNEIGLTSILLGERRLNDALQWPVNEPYLAVLAAGPQTPNPSELLSTPRMREVMASLEEAADIVVVDSPSVLPVTDALVIAELTDATILVASAASSSRRTLSRASRLLEQVDVQLVGTVLNAADVEPSSYDRVQVPAAQHGSARAVRAARLSAPSTNGHRPAPEPITG
jgi:capsular exopolysaccharide synthesis family protein